VARTNVADYLYRYEPKGERDDGNHDTRYGLARETVTELGERAGVRGHTYRFECEIGVAS
jgi:hypothetical protein